MSAILGIDFGLRHLGVAVAVSGIAQPVASLSTDSPWPKLADIISKYHISQIVVGLPDGPIGEPASRFIADLQTHFSLPVIPVDETLSSRESQQLLMHTTPSRRARLDHAAAAAVLLQNWLDSLPRS